VTGVLRPELRKLSKVNGKNRTKAVYKCLQAAFFEKIRRFADSIVGFFPQPLNEKCTCQIPLKIERYRNYT
jgi:hypothetical protein